MTKVSVDEALQKGRKQLVWMPMILFFGLMASGIFTVMYFISIGITLFILSFILPWIWWSVKVVKWKIWAFDHVEDLKTLERKAVSQQLIWPQGSWFEKTEIKTRKEKQLLELLYIKIHESSFAKELVQDNKLPIEMVIKYPKINIYFYLLMIPLGIYLIYSDRLIFGIISIAAGCWLAVNLYRKVTRQHFLLKLNHHGVSLPHAFFPWNSIEEYFIEQSGYGNSTTYTLIIKGPDIYETVLLSDVNIGAYTIEKHMDVYRSRFELLNPVKKD